MIKNELPPNFERIAAVIPAIRGLAMPDHSHPDFTEAPAVLFAYGEDIYNPKGVLLGAELIAHEYRHCARQWQQVDAWWEKYLTDPEFRYAEELLAHVEEYITLAKATKDKNQRAKILQRTAHRLVAPLYNYQPPRSATQAVRDIYMLAHG